MPICFDLDGTLGSFGGGYRLLREALGELWGAEPSAEELHACTGSTDWEIVDELHRLRFGRPLPAPDYLAYEAGCLRRFMATFPDDPPAHQSFPGLLAALRVLHRSGVPVAVVSGNAPRVLDFKLARLDVDAGLPRLGSLPGLDRTALLARSRAADGGPHLYVGDRPHDLDAAQRNGMPFLGVGARVPEAPIRVSPEADAQEVLAHIQALVLGAT